MDQRKIIHIDMDAFYASVEQRDDPALRGKPVAVGGSGERSVVAAASYEARVFGVRSAMPSVRARRNCPDLIFVPPRFDVYRAVSRQIRAIFADYTPLIEPLSLDEAYLDVTGDLKGIGSATAIAKEIRARIREATGLTASAGVSYNKFIAKLASDQNKPDGLCVITPRRGPDFVAALPVRRFHGVGPVTAQKMERLGIHTGADLRDRDLAFLIQHFGSSASYFHEAAHGIDRRPVDPDRPLKSISAETTYDNDLMDEAGVLGALDELVEIAWGRCTKAGAFGRTVTLKVRYGDFRMVTRSRSASAPLEQRDQVAEYAAGLVRALPAILPGVRLLGVTVSGFENRDRGQTALPL